MRTIIQALTIVTAVSIATSALAGPLDRFSGRWAGWGEVATTSGNSEKLKCATTYKVIKGGTKARQNFRCQSASYRFDAVANYTAKGAMLSGDWRETIYSVGGSLKGRIRGGIVDMTIRADSFVGQVGIRSAKCRQSISIRPSGGVEISSIIVNLRRC